jgi:ribosomal protein L11 methyltransferase
MSKEPYYIELRGHAKGISPADLEIAVAFISSYPFDSFDNEDHVLKAFAKATDISNEVQREIETLIEPFVDQIQWIQHEYENWNKKWEENYFQPLDVGSFHVRAPFHPISNQTHVITIEPRMSFGTGHHGTTRLMLEFIETYHEFFQNAQVLDMGTGTGILAIAAEKIGAKHVLGIEIDDWVVENAIDNVNANNCTQTEIRLGTADLLSSDYDETFDIVIANIHREVILADLAHYYRVLKTKGLLFISGLQFDDVPSIDQVAHSLTLTKDLQKSIEDWQGLVYLKGKW